MKPTLLAASLAALMTTAASAEDIHNYVACDTLTGSPYVCVFNGTKSAVTGLACEGWFGHKSVAVPRGSIPAGKVAIVKFDVGHGACKAGIHATTSGGQDHVIRGQDIDTVTVLDISSDGSW